MAVLIDSDILIEVSRGSDQVLLERWTDLSESDDLLLCSPVTVAELWHGAKPREHGSLEDLFSVLTCVSADHETGRKAGEYLRAFGRSHGVELGDALIAAAAALHDAELWTRNRKHYPMPGLRFR